MNRNQKNQGFNASAYQVRCAYQVQFGRDVDGSKTYAASAQEIVDAIGFDAAQALIQGQANDASQPYPLNR